MQSRKCVYRFFDHIESFVFGRNEFVNGNFVVEKLLERIRKYQGNRFETRAFVYLDIISWLESKIENIPVQKIIHEKYKRKK